MKTHKRVVTSYDTVVDGIPYRVCIFFYDDEHYTADWTSKDGSEWGELGFGLGQCIEVEYEVVQWIRKQRQERLAASQDGK